MSSYFTLQPKPHERPFGSSKSSTAKLQLLHLPIEILFEISRYLGPKDISSLVLIGHRVSGIFTPSLLQHALSEKYCLTTLYLAAAKRDQSMVRFLLSQGAPIVIVDYRANTLTISATSRLPLSELAGLVLTEGGESIILSDSHKETAFHRAAGGGYEKLAKILLSKGALTMYRDESGWTPLRWVGIEAKLHSFGCFGHMMTTPQSMAARGGCVVMPLTDSGGIAWLDSVIER